jgi:hypothetical protein
MPTTLQVRPGRYSSKPRRQQSEEVRARRSGGSREPSAVSSLRLEPICHDGQDDHAYRIAIAGTDRLARARRPAAASSFDSDVAAVTTIAAGFRPARDFFPRADDPEEPGERSGRRRRSRMAPTTSSQEVLPAVDCNPRNADERKV